MPKIVWITDNNVIELLGITNTPTEWFKMVEKAGQDDQQVINVVNLFLRARAADFRVRAKRLTQNQEFTIYPGIERVTKHFLTQVSDYQPRVGTCFNNVHDWEVKLDTH